jgi:hypothetical protein
VQFTAAVVTEPKYLAAPADGATASSFVRIFINGSGMENVELLPSTGYAPILGVFDISADKTGANILFDTTKLPNGILSVRVSAFDKPAGTSGANEIVAMPTRNWTLVNNPEPFVTSIPPANVMPEVHISLSHLPYVDPQTLEDLTAQDNVAFADMVANDWPKVESAIRMYVPATVIFYPPTPLGFHAAYDACIGGHNPVGCRETMNYLIGVMQSKQ